MEKSHFLLITVCILLTLPSVSSQDADIVYAEFYVKSMTEAVTKEIDLYRGSRNGLSFETLRRDSAFRDLIFQDIGPYGYGVLIDRETGLIVLHPIASFEGYDFGKHLMENADHPGLAEAIRDGEPACGYYLWNEPNQTFERKFLCLTPVEIRGRPFSYALTSYVDHFKEHAITQGAQINDRTGPLPIDMETLGRYIAEDIASLYSQAVNDTLFLAMEFRDGRGIPAISHLQEQRDREMWFNIGTDLEPLGQHKTIPLYAEVSITDEKGIEIIRYDAKKNPLPLRDLKDARASEFPNETIYLETAKLGEGEVRIGPLLTWYTPKEDVFRGVGQDSIGDYSKVIARDAMKEGVIRFATPIFKNGVYSGSVILSLDYRHLQELSKHISPGNREKVLSNTYTGNYILVFDNEGSTMVHPKPDNIRGYLRDGRFAGYNGQESDVPGNIFNLYSYNGSASYPEIAHSVLIKKGTHISSATDVGGRTKLTVSVPILFDNQRTNLGRDGVIGGVMLSINIQNSTAIKENPQNIQTVQLNKFMLISLSISIILISFFFIILFSVNYSQSPLAKPLRDLTLGGIFYIILGFIRLNSQDHHLLLILTSLQIALFFAFIIQFSLLVLRTSGIINQRKKALLFQAACLIGTLLVFMREMMSEMTFTFLPSIGAYQANPGNTFFPHYILFFIIWSSLIVTLMLAQRQNKERQYLWPAIVILAWLGLPIVWSIFIAPIGSLCLFYHMITPVLMLLVFYKGFREDRLIEQSKDTTAYTLSIIFIIIVAILIFSAVTTSIQVKQDAIESLHEQEHIIGSTIASDISNIYNFMEYVTRLLGARIMEGETLDRDLSWIIDRGIESHNDFIEEIILLNSSDHVIIGKDNDARIINTRIEGNEPLAKMKESGSATQGYIPELTGGKNVSVIFSPIMIDGKYLGGIGFILSPYIFTEHFESSPHIKRDIQITDEKGIVLFSTGPDYIGKNILTLFPANVDDLKKSLASDIDTRYLDRADPDMLIVSIPVDKENIDWTLFMISDTKTAYLETDKNLDSIWIFFFMSIIALVGLGFISFRVLTRSLKSQIDEKTKEMKGAISELKDTKAAVMNMMEDVMQANENLKELDQAKSNFLNIVSHELKTPLTAMSAHLEVIEDLSANLNEQQVSSFEAVRRNANQLRILIDNILEISRIESGKFQLNYSQVSPQEILDEVANNLRIVAKKQGISIKVKSKDTKPVRADEARLREILNNLVSNAIKFTPKGSVTITLEKGKGDIIIKVADTGIGIPKEKMKNLFTKFYQVDATLGRRYGGTGLGLSITKQLIELQGGKIWVESEEGKGSVFSFSLPTDRREP